MAVARVLPRLWDAPRLMRFLAGLALMALAFAAHAGLAVPVTPSVAETSVTTTVDVPAAPDLPAAAPEQAVVTPLTGPDAAAVVEASAPVGDAVAPAGPAGSAYGSRAPPRR